LFAFRDAGVSPVRTSGILPENYRREMTGQDGRGTHRQDAGKMPASVPISLRRLSRARFKTSATAAAIKGLKVLAWK
jgi:hypothetical protein